MKTRTLGTATVSAIGLGGMPLSIEGRPDRDRALRTIHAYEHLQQDGKKSG